MAEKFKNYAGSQCSAINCDYYKLKRPDLNFFRFTLDRCTGPSFAIPKNMFHSFAKNTFQTFIFGTRSHQFRCIRYFKSRTGLVKQTQKKSLAPVEECEGIQRGFKDLFKPFCFTILISSGSFCGAAIWQYENMRLVAREKLKVFTDQLPSQDSFYGKAGGIRRKVNEWWNSLQSGQKMVAGIIGLNVGVFVLWRIQPMTFFMAKYFTSSPSSSAVCWPLLLSAFSHHWPLHLFANMYVLWSFAPAADKLLGKEQFLGTYISGAMVAGFSSYLYKIVRRRSTPSLGASGAIMAILGAVCTAIPQAQLSIAFVDQIVPHSFSADSGMKALILLDTMGVLFGWRFFDHAAHLGGMLFGIWYVKYGHKMIWKKREPLMRFWHSIRGRP